jgi:hypothetical protein
MTRASGSSPVMCSAAPAASTSARLGSMLILQPRLMLARCVRTGARDCNLMRRGRPPSSPFMCRRIRNARRGRAVVDPGALRRGESPSCFGCLSPVARCNPVQPRQASFADGDTIARRRRHVSFPSRTRSVPSYYEILLAPKFYGNERTLMLGAGAPLV